MVLGERMFEPGRAGRSEIGPGLTSQVAAQISAASLSKDIDSGAALHGILERLPEPVAVKVLASSPCSVEQHLQRLPAHMHHLALRAEFPELVQARSLHLDCGSHDRATLVAALDVFKDIPDPQQLSITNPSLVDMSGHSSGFEAAVWSAVQLCDALVVHDQAEVPRPESPAPKRLLSREGEPHALLHGLYSSSRLRSLQLLGPRYVQSEILWKVLPRLTGLQSLEVGDYNFPDILPGADQQYNVAAALKNLTTLTKLVLRNYECWGKHSVGSKSTRGHALASVQSLTGLQSLHLQVYFLSDIDEEMSSALRGSLHTLTSLDMRVIKHLYRAQVEPDGMPSEFGLKWQADMTAADPLVQAVRSLTRLRRLRITFECQDTVRQRLAGPCWDCMDPEGAGLPAAYTQSLATAVEKLPQLESLSLTVEEAGTPVDQVLSALCKTQTVTQLALQTDMYAAWQSHSTDVPLVQLLKKISELRSLRSLQLSGLFTHNAWAESPMFEYDHKCMSGLTSLDISLHEVAPVPEEPGPCKVLAGFIPFLASCPRLKSLVLCNFLAHHQDVGGSALEQQEEDLVHAIGNMHDLQTLHLAGFLLQGSTIGDALSRLDHLTSLHVHMPYDSAPTTGDNAPYGGYWGHTLSPSELWFARLGCLSKLQRLQLGRMQLRGGHAEQFAEAAAHLLRLTSLTLEDCNAEWAVVCRGVAQLGALKQLSVKNSLSGKWRAVDERHIARMLQVRIPCCG